jgi:hypothetical protein
MAFACADPISDAIRYPGDQPVAEPGTDYTYPDRALRINPAP